MKIERARRTFVSVHEVMSYVLERLGLPYKEHEPWLSWQRKEYLYVLGDEHRSTVTFFNNRETLDCQISSPDQELVDKFLLILDTVEWTPKSLEPRDGFIVVTRSFKK